ncbi:uncharacterized protein HGUI_01833 [Hanseniaspora guilliermondii]|uniref:C3H1-type domain-containing protein n=1 Tax=Hanseniaspora guilliermondii TaxID=56406 RepID=A0A1L0CMJ6_9ASCO|nr:uncharacterized protein HGUI_01833 [Hanseniaspora guilliermondii]
MNNYYANNACNSFSRQGSCKFGMNCNNKHVKPVDISQYKIFVLLNLLPKDYLETLSKDDIKSIYISLFNTFNKFGEIKDIIININDKGMFLDGNVYIQFVNENSLKTCLNKFRDDLQFEGRFVENNVITGINDLSEIVCKNYHLGACTHESCSGIHYYKFDEEEWKEVLEDSRSSRKFTIRDKLILISHKMWSSGISSNMQRNNNRTYNNGNNSSSYPVGNRFR